MSKSKIKVWRHGDISFVKINELPPNLSVHSKVIAEGEISGHLHAFTEQSLINCYVNDQDQQFVQVIEPALINHPEHGIERIPSGIYQVRKSRELDLIGTIQSTRD